MYDQYALDLKTIKFNDKQLKKISDKIVTERQQGISPFVRLQARK
jgi:hypothetical protein